MEKNEASRFMRDLLKLMIEKKGSDLFITVGFPPAIKIDGKITPVAKTALTEDNTKALIYSIMQDRHLKEFEATKECNFAVSPAGIGRFRASAFVQKGYRGIVFRVIETEVPSFEQLGLPNVMKDIAMTRSGLVVMVGGNGTGKTTSLAAMIDYRNENSYGHIITVEDPIEYVHKHKHCVITQREVGTDTDNWDNALKNALRQAPNVLLIGEIRDRETMEFCLSFAKTGHLAMATLHANSANQAMDRIINFFPDHRKLPLLMDLSTNLRAVVSQRLLKDQKGKGLVAAVEVMLQSPLVAELIMKGEIHEIKPVMAKSNTLGMKTFDQALFELYEAGRVSYEDALNAADSVNELRLHIKLQGKELDGKDNLENPMGLSLQEDHSGIMGRPLK